MEDDRRDDEGLNSLLEASSPAGHFRRVGNGGICLSCQEPVDLTEEGMMGHLGAKHPEAAENNVLTIHDDEDDGEEDKAAGEHDGETTLVILGGPDDGKTPEISQELEEEDLIRSYFKEKDGECRLCGERSSSKKDMVKHVLESHNSAQVGEEEDEEEQVFHVVPEEIQHTKLKEEPFFPQDDEDIEGEPAKRLKLFKEKKEARSVTWQFFEKVGDKEVGEVRCIICSKHYHTTGGSTTVMHRHLNKEHPEELRDIKEEIKMEDDQKEDPNKPGRKSSRSLVWTYFVKGVEPDTVICNLCHKKYNSSDGSTGIMLRHLRREHLKEYEVENSKRESQEDVENRTPLPTKKPLRKSQMSRSSVWSYFTKNQDSSVKCKICYRDYSNIGGSTSAMLRHLRKSHADLDIDNLHTPTPSILQSQLHQRRLNKNFTPSGENEIFTVVMKNNALPVVCKPPGPGSEKLSVSENILLEGFALERDECKHSDVKIVCKDGQIVRTHKLVLASTSLLMYEIFKSLPDDDEDATIIAPDISCEKLTVFIDKLYKGGDVSLDEVVEIVCDFGFKMERINYPNREILEGKLMVFGQPEVDVTFQSDNDDDGDDPVIYETQEDSSQVQYFSVPKENVSPPSNYNPSTKIEVVGGVVLKQEKDEIKEGETMGSRSEPPTHSKRKSAIWNFFTKDETDDSSSCHSCLKKVSCKQHSTSSMIKHLQRHHKTLYDEFYSVSPKESPSGTPKEPKPEKPAKSQEDRTCSICLKVFSTRNKMTVHHKAVHLGIKAYTCDICGKSYSRVDTLKDHVSSTHTVNGPTFLCKYCGKVFKRRATRFRHERFHRNDRRHQCSFCPKKFFTNQTLRNHERTHTGEKPFQCNQCNRRFAMMHQLTTHMRVHTGDKPYRCNYCLESFKYSSSKNKHFCVKMPTEQQSLIASGKNKKKTPLLQGVEEVIVPITSAETITDGGEITTTYRTVVKEGVIQEIQESMEISEHSEEEILAT